MSGRPLACCSTVKDVLTGTIEEVLTPLVRRLVLEELRVAVLEAGPKWLTTEQAAARIGISSSGVRERIRRGDLPARKWDGRHYVAAAWIDGAIDGAEPSAKLRTHSGNGPRAAATAEGLATRRNPS